VLFTLWLKNRFTSEEKLMLFDDGISFEKFMLESDKVGKILSLLGKI
jgi:hypothetical protein